MNIIGAEIVLRVMTRGQAMSVQSHAQTPVIFIIVVPSPQRALQIFVIWLSRTRKSVIKIILQIVRAAQI